MIFTLPEILRHCLGAADQIAALAIMQIPNYIWLVINETHHGSIPPRRAT
jgi:hypothetical protein